MAVARFTYQDDPTESDLQATRYYTGDTVREVAEIDDKELAFALTQHPEPRIAAAICLEQLSAKYAKRASFTAGEVSKELGDRSEALHKAALNLREEALKRALPTMGVQTLSGKRTLQNDPDADQPNFTIGRFDNPQATQIGPTGPTRPPDGSGT